MILFRERLKQARAEAGIKSQEALAEALGVTKMTVFRWEKGETEPSFADIEKLSIVLKKPVFWFFQGEEPEEQAEPSLSEILAHVKRLEAKIERLSRGSSDGPNRPGGLGSKAAS